MIKSQTKAHDISFTPGITVNDKLAGYWLKQVTIRLRREIWWNWHERGLIPEENTSSLPPFTDKIPSIMEMEHVNNTKKIFLEKDTTAHFLNSKLNMKIPKIINSSPQGSFSWVSKQLKLDKISCFTLALAVETIIDNTLGSVISSCLNDPDKHQPNLALIQKLWDNPNDVINLSDPAHPLFMYGLLQTQQPDNFNLENRFNTPFYTSSAIASQLISPVDSLPRSLQYIKIKNDKDLFISERVTVIANRLKAKVEKKFTVVPILGSTGSLFEEPVESISILTGKQTVRYRGDSSLLSSPAYLKSIASLCWIMDIDLFLNTEQISAIKTYQNHAQNYLLPIETIPITIYLSIYNKSELAPLSLRNTLPVVETYKLTYSGRREYWKKNLKTGQNGISKIINECARRFRFEKETIKNICLGLISSGKQITEKDLFDACRTEVSTEMGELAQKITPRFHDEKLVLPQDQDRQFSEIVKGMKSLTTVHYEIGTGKAWNESGISVMFSGPAGTGKTMAAEILAIKLDLPIYRIDLSQVVNKYIGETEKNLKKIFDAADKSDTILFFDEADALFGKRTDVKDAHDRYANLETSYLLERMEHFKGLAILATNKKKNIDEAFLRRLRYIIDFPLPAVREREKIWRQVIPKTIDTSEIDFNYLSKNFQLTGGNIRSIVFNACLQSVNEVNTGRKKFKAKLKMDDIIIALKRELQKMNRTIPQEQLGDYAGLFEESENEQTPN